MGDLLRGERVRLAAMTADDLPVLARWYADDGFSRSLTAKAAVPKDATGLRPWFERAVAEDTLFAVRPADGDTFLGFTQIDGVLWTHRVGGLTIAIGEPGHGYGGEALRLTIGFAFRELNLHRLQLTVFAYNARAVRLYERAGFQREGAFREFLERDGRRYDMYLYGLLRTEWAGAGRG